MLSDEYWKDKMIDNKQVVSAWILVSLLAAGAYYAEVAVRNATCDTVPSTRAASLDDARDSAGIRARDLR